MRTQEQIQQDMTLVISDLAKFKDTINSETPFEDVLKQYPDIKTRWDDLMKEAEELRSKAMWKFG